LKPPYRWQDWAAPYSDKSRHHKTPDAIRVCEVIRDEAGDSWPDVSAWYWNTMFGASRAPWWSFVVAESTS
jgi:hypothetical protein